MKKTIWIIVAGLVVIVCGYCWTTYNTLAKLDQGVEAAWADIETQYQRRADLIPNLVSTVKGYALILLLVRAISTIINAVTKSITAIPKIVGSTASFSGAIINVPTV